MTIKTGVWLLVVAGVALGHERKPEQRVHRVHAHQSGAMDAGERRQRTLLQRDLRGQYVGPGQRRGGGLRPAPRHPHLDRGERVRLLAGRRSGILDFQRHRNHGPWIGGTQPGGSPEPAGGWSWVTGETFGFNAWYAGEPNDAGGIENRIQFFDGTRWSGPFRPMGRRTGDVRPAPTSPSGSTRSTSTATARCGRSPTACSSCATSSASPASTLTTGAVDLTDCTRCDAAAIQPFLARLVRRHRLRRHRRTGRTR